jgi:hypothetical protein
MNRPCKYIRIPAGRLSSQKILLLDSKKWRPRRDLPTSLRSHAILAWDRLLVPTTADENLAAFPIRGDHIPHCVRRDKLRDLPTLLRSHSLRPPRFGYASLRFAGVCDAINFSSRTADEKLAASEGLEPPAPSLGRGLAHYARSEP